MIVTPWQVGLSLPGGEQLAVWEWGCPTGPEILLVHGLAQCHLSFSRQMSGRLAEEFRIVALDLLGHGDSAKPDQTALYKDGRRWADEISAVIHAKALRRPVLVGWSMGGRVVRSYLMHHGDSSIAGINFVSSQVIEDPSRAVWNSQLIEQDGTPDLPTRLTQAMAFLEACYHVQPTKQEFALTLAYNMLVPWTVRRAIAGWATDPIMTLEALRHVRVPILITHGAEDRILPVSLSMTLSKNLPTSRLSTYLDCGHSPFFENAERFNTELATFADMATGKIPT